MSREAILISRDAIDPFVYRTARGPIVIRRFVNGQGELMAGEMEILPGSGLAPHRHQPPEIYLPLTSNHPLPSITMNGKTQPILAHVPVYIPSNVVHGIDVVLDCAVRFLYVFAVHNIEQDVVYDYELTASSTPMQPKATPTIHAFRVCEDEYTIHCKQDVLLLSAAPSALIVAGACVDAVWIPSGGTVSFELPHDTTLLAMWAQPTAGPSREPPELIRKGFSRAFGSSLRGQSALD
ncbi:MAG: hypothetical protein AAF493_16050 [Pseudomonadota bacterium]